mgnify:CR=1 FL=1
MIVPESIQNVVLDLGGVLYAIDPPATFMALKSLAGPNATAMTLDHPLFLDFEMGLVSPSEFREALRSAIDSRASDKAIDFAWNALLLGPIEGRVAWVERLARKYRVILLSNTNVIHQEIWGPQCADMFDLMEHTWFSFDLGKRKPNKDIYDFVMAEMGMKPAESLFLDDSRANIEGAAAAGWQTAWVDANDNAHFEQYCLELLAKL